MMHFQKLVSATVRSLVRRNVSRDELVSQVMTLGAFGPVVEEPKLPLLQFCFHKLEAADTIPKIFLVLKDYFSFFNYEIVEHIIEVLGTDEDKAKFQSYKDKFDQYAKQRIYACGPHFGLEIETDHSNIFVKLDSQYDNYTGVAIKGFCCKLSEALHISPQGVLRLCRVQKGCLQLKFQIPLFVQQRIFPLSREQERTLADMGIIMIICGRYQFQANEDAAEKPQCNFDICGKFVYVATSVKAYYFAYVTFLPGDEVEASEEVRKKLQLSSETESVSDGMCLISKFVGLQNTICNSYALFHCITGEDFMVYESVKKKLQLDIDRDSSIGFSVFTSEKSTILSEVTLSQSYCL